MKGTKRKYRSEAVWPTRGEDTTAVPPIIEPAVYTPVSCSDTKFVYFDMETTSLYKDGDIVQLSAVYDEHTFDLYVLPIKPIQEDAEEVNGLQVKNRQLCYRGEVVDTVSTKQCITQFIQWLKTFVPGNIILVQHNCRSFDAPRLLNHVTKTGKRLEFMETVLGFCDTLRLFGARYKAKYESFSKKSLVKEILHREMVHHNDANAVRELIRILLLAQSDFTRQALG